MNSFSRKDRKIKEKVLLWGAVALAAMLMFVSNLSDTPFPGAFQFAAVCLFAASVLLLSKCILRSFSYEITPAEADTDPPDLVIVERVGQRSTVVCRISASQIADGFSLPAGQKKEFFKLCKGKRVFRYTDELFPNALFVLRVEENGESEYLILPDCPEAPFFRSLNSLIKKSEKS